MEITIFFFTKDTSLYVTHPLLQLFHIEFSVAIFFSLDRLTLHGWSNHDTVAHNLYTNDISLSSLPEFLKSSKKRKDVEKLPFDDTQLLLT